MDWTFKHYVHHHGIHCCIVVSLHHPLKWQGWGVATVIGGVVLEWLVCVMGDIRWVGLCQLKGGVWGVPDLLVALTPPSLLSHCQSSSSWFFLSQVVLFVYGWLSLSDDAAHSLTCHIIITTCYVK